MNIPSFCVLQEFSEFSNKVTSSVVKRLERALSVRWLLYRFSWNILLRRTMTDSRRSSPVASRRPQTPKEYSKSIKTMGILILSHIPAVALTYLDNLSEREDFYVTAERQILRKFSPEIPKTVVESFDQVLKWSRQQVTVMLFQITFTYRELVPCNLFGGQLGVIWKFCWKLSHLICLEASRNSTSSAAVRQNSRNCFLASEHSDEVSNWSQIVYRKRLQVSNSLYVAIVWISNTGDLLSRSIRNFSKGITTVLGDFGLKLQRTFV